MNFSGSVLVLDEMTPGDGPTAAFMQEKCDIVVTRQANGKGKGRMNVDRSNAPAIDPRGALLSTGEVSITRRSALGRTLSIPFGVDAQGRPTWADMAEFQKIKRAGTSGQLAMAMACFIQWIAKRGLKSIRTELRGLVSEITLEINQLPGALGSHARHPETLAELHAGFKLFLKYAVHTEAISQVDSEGSAGLHFGWLTSLLARQAEAQDDSDPGKRFIALLQSAVTSHGAYIVDASTGDCPDGREAACGWKEEFKYQGSEIGQVLMWIAPINTRALAWLQGDDLYLNPDRAMAVANELAKRGGSTIGTRHQIQTRLQEMGVIPASKLRKDGKLRGTQRAVVGKARSRFEVWTLDCETLGIPREAPK